MKPLTKFTSSWRITEFKDILSRNISQIITETVTISMRIVKPSNETGHPVLSLRENQWKLRQQHDQDFPLDKVFVEQILVSEEK